MKLNVKATALTAGLLWGIVGVFGVSLLNVIWPGYGEPILKFAVSIYPGYNAGPGVGQILLGTVYAFVDAAILGAIFAWLYNRFLGRTT